MPWLPLLLSIAAGAAERAWDAEHLDLDLRVLPSAGAVEGRATWRVRPLRPGPLVLHQEHLDIQALWVDGARYTDWWIRENRVEVALSPGLHEVTLAWSATPESGMHFREADQGYTREVWTDGEPQENRHWIPIWDEPSDRFTATLRVTVPRGMSVHANGLRVAVEPTRGERRFTYEVPFQLISYTLAFTAGSYQVQREQRGDVALEFVGGARHSPAELEALFAPTREILPWLEGNLGPYPYPLYRQVVVQGLPWSGMENTANTFIGDHRLPSQWPSASRERERLLAHELTHQWFGDHLSIAGWEDLWLNEALATWWASRWIAHREGDLSAALDREEEITVALGVTLPVSPDVTHALEEPWYPRVYAKGALVLHALDVWAGREAIDAGLRAYLERFGGRSARTEDLLMVLEAHAGMELRWIFDQWVWGGGNPRVRTSWEWRSGTLTVVLVQGGDPWKLPVTLEIGTAQGPLYARRLVREREAVWSLSLPEPPAWVAVDPHQAALTEWTHIQSESAWIAQFQRSPSPDARLTALRALERGDPSEAALRALRTAWLNSEAPPRWRARVARALGEQRAGSLLLEGIDAPQGELRLAMWRALSEIPRGPTVPPFPAHPEDDPEVQAARLLAEAIHQPRAAIPTARSWSRIHHDTPHLVAAAQVLGHLGRAREAALLRGLTSARHPRAVRLSALTALAALHGRESGVPVEPSFRTAIPLTHSPDRRVRQAALRFLGTLHTPEARAALRAWAEASEVPADRDLARELAGP